MKRILNVWVATFVVLTIMFTVQSCTDEPCEGVTCFNGGVCVDGTCDCAPGFGGTDCANVLDQCVANGTVCLNGGTCDPATGDCDCPAGFVGDSCETELRAEFIDIWSVSEDCNDDGIFGENAHNVTISRNTGSPTEILMRNLGNYICLVNGSPAFYDITADVGTNGTALFNMTSCSIAFVGNAFITSQGKLQVNYSATYDPGGGSVTDNCVILSD